MTSFAPSPPPAARNFPRDSSGPPKDAADKRHLQREKARRTRMHTGAQAHTHNPPKKVSLMRAARVSRALTCVWLSHLAKKRCTNRLVRPLPVHSSSCRIERSIVVESPPVGCLSFEKYVALFNQHHDSFPCSYAFVLGPLLQLIWHMVALRTERDKTVSRFLNPPPPHLPPNVSLVVVGAVGWLKCGRDA